MSDEIRKQTFILARRRTILLIYLLLVCIKTFHAIITSKYIGENLFVLAVYGVLVALIYRGNKIANWIMILLILLSGVGSSFIGIALVPFKQYVVKTFLTVIGLYFIYGSLRLIALERT